jgi:hypothetical protein
MKSALLTATLMLLSVRATAATDDRWQYHGIHLGAKMTPNQIMAALGAPKYAMNPDIDVWNNHLGCADEQKAKTPVCKSAPFHKYGLKALEVVETQIGPYCEQKKDANDKPIMTEFSCTNPFMLASFPNWSEKGHGVTSLSVFVRNGVVSSIDMFFDSLNAEDFFEVARRQLGADHWTTEPEQFWIANWNEIEKGAQAGGQTVQRITMTKKTPLYSAMMTNYDQIISHPTMPTYRGVCELKLLDQTL